MRLSSMRFTTFFVLVFLISFQVVLILSFMYRNSTPAQNVTFNNGLPFQNTALSYDNFSGRCNCTVSEDSNSLYFLDGLGQVKELQRKIQNDTASANNNIIASQEGSNNSSLTSSKNDEYKLLNGLLASGFDESSCISRVQSHLYRKASPHKPSPYLMSKLRNYEEIHKRCGPYSRAYNTSMANIEGSKNNSVATMCKYLVWTPESGLGNQMLSIVSTFLYALLTDRILLVNFGKDKQNLFCEPFLNSTWILPKDSPFWNRSQRYKNIPEKEKAKNSKEDSPSVLFLDLGHRYKVKFFHCDHSQVHLNKVPLLIFLSNNYFVPSLFMTPLFNEELHKMFPDKDTIFHHLGRYLFHPSNGAWEMIAKFYQTHLANADEKIGLQIRNVKPVSTPEKEFMDLVLSCTKNHNILPELGVQNSSIKKNQAIKAVLVASLHAQYAEDLKAMYENKATITGEIIQVYQASHEEQQKYNDNKHNMKALADIYLLSLCDVLVTTSKSTFGYVAQGLGNLKPWLRYDYKLGNNETHLHACETDFSMESCLHAPPKLFCDGKPIQNLVSSFLHLRECKDYCFGVKLFNGNPTQAFKSESEMRQCAETIKMSR